MNIIKSIFFTALSFMLLGCGSSDNSEQDLPLEQEIPKEEEVFNVPYLDELWLPGSDRNFISLGDELLVHAYFLHSLKLSEQGLIESPVNYSAHIPNRIALLSDSTVVMSFLNHVALYQYQGGVFDLLHETQKVKETSQSRLTAYNNCTYWINGTEEAPRSRVQRLCKNANDFTESKVYQTTNYISNVRSLGNGLFVMFEDVEDIQHMSLFDLNFTELDRKTSSDKWYGSDYELLNNTLYFQGHRTLWKVSINNNKFGEVSAFEEQVPLTGKNGENNISVAENLLITALDRNIRIYQMDGDRIIKQHTVELSYVIDTIHIEGDFVIASYIPPHDESDSIGIQIYSLADLLKVGS